MSVRVIVALAAALLLVLFAVQNTKPVEVNLLVWQVTAPASVAVFVAFACGVLVGVLFFWTEQRRSRGRQPLAGPGPPAQPAPPGEKKEKLGGERRGVFSAPPST